MWTIQAFISDEKRLRQDSAEVTLFGMSPNERSGQRVILRKEGTSWTVTHLTNDVD